MPSPGAGGVQTSLVGRVQSMMATARSALRRKPGAPVENPGDKNNPADLSQFVDVWRSARWRMSIIASSGGNTGNRLSPASKCVYSLTGSRNRSCIQLRSSPTPHLKGSFIAGLMNS